jgi:uncharacterized membrane protein
MPRWTAVLFALVLVAVAAGGSAGAAVTQSDAVTEFEVAQEFDRTQFRIAVHPNGSARWTFHYERTLANESERQQFEAFAEDFNAEETTLYTDFRNQSRSLVSQGEDATGRGMAAEAFERRAYVASGLNDVGVVEMAFTWTGFAPVEDDRVIVGDVFEGGLYIGADQALVVRAADGLVFQSVEPSGTLSGQTLATSDTVTWTGERTFTDNRPRVVLAPADAGPGTTTGDGVTTTADPGSTTATAEPSSPVWPVVLVVLVIAAAIGGFLYRRRERGADPSADQSPDTPSVDEAALLDDESRVEDLLREHGGRMRQSAIVEATGWSKSKVSMVLSEMEEADRVRKLRVGRENIVSLPGHEPDAAGSPHDADE